MNRRDALKKLLATTAIGSASALLPALPAAPKQKTQMLQVTTGSDGKRRFRVVEAWA